VRRDERLLGDVLSGRLVADDEQRCPMGAPPVHAKQLLEILPRAGTDTCEQASLVAVRALQRRSTTLVS
jgi:hypothetical protein